MNPGYLHKSFLLYFRSWRFNRHGGEIYFYLKFTYVVQHIVVMVGSTVVMMGFSLIGAINVVVVVKKLHLTTVLGHVRGTIRTISSKRTRRL